MNARTGDRNWQQRPLTAEASRNDDENDTMVMNARLKFLCTGAFRQEPPNVMATVTIILQRLRLVTMSRDHFWRSISRDTNVEVSTLSPLVIVIETIKFYSSKLKLQISPIQGNL